MGFKVTRQPVYRVWENDEGLDFHRNFYLVSKPHSQTRRKRYALKVVPLLGTTDMVVETESSQGHPKEGPCRMSCHPLLTSIPRGPSQRKLIMIEYLPPAMPIPVTTMWNRIKQHTWLYHKPAHGSSPRESKRNIQPPPTGLRSINKLENRVF